MSGEKVSYTRKQASDAFGPSVETIDRAIKAGDLETLPKPKVNGKAVGLVLITHAEMCRWLGIPA